MITLITVHNLDDEINQYIEPSIFIEFTTFIQKFK